MRCPKCNKALSHLEGKHSVCAYCGYDNNYSNDEIQSDERLLNDAQLLLCNKIAMNNFHRKLLYNYNPGIEYFNGRGLNKATIEKFKLGFADNRGAMLKHSFAKLGLTEEEMLETKLLSRSQKNGKLYECYFNRVMFPIFDIENNVIGFGGRVLDDSKPKYLNSFETPVFQKRKNMFGMNIAKNSKYPYFILCEGFMDVISLHSAGFSNAIASLGTALTKEQAELIKKYKNTVYISYDSDGPGRNAIKRAIPTLQNAGITTKVINLNPYKDPDELIIKQGKVEYQKRLSEAKSGDRFIVQTATDNQINVLKNILLKKHL